MRSALLSCLVALLAFPAGALASDELRVEPEGEEARSLTLSAIGEPDVRGQSYTLPGGERSAVTGWSLDRVLTKAGVDPYRFGGIELQTATGGVVDLTRDVVVDPSGFPDGPPVFFLENGDLRFLRPVDDAGAPALLVGGGPAVLRLPRTGRLKVTARASTRRTRPGRPVTFTATVTGARAGEPVTISWYFDDGRSAQGQRVRHRFARPGTYDVVVGVTTPSDPTGADASVTVQVGKPPRGPNRKGGGTSNDPAAPDSGAATGGGASGGGGSPGGGGAPAQGAPSTPSPAPTPAQSTPPPPPSAAPRARAPRRPQRKPATKRSRSKRDEPPVGGRLREVEGIELAGISALSSQAGRDAVAAARRGRLREDERRDGAGIPPWLPWSAGLAGLLALGAWREGAGRPHCYGPRNAADRWIWF